jgi:enoyl-CoA hydratase
MPGVVSFGVDGVVARIGLDDGDRNTVDGELVDALGEALDHAEQALARAVVLEGRPGVFCSGITPRLLARLDPISRRHFVRELGRLVLRLYQFPRPVVAAVTGHATAGGAILALAADIRIAARGPFQIGIGDGVVGALLPGFALELARAQVPCHAHTRWIGFGELVDPDTARQMWLVDRIVPPERVLFEAVQEANKLAALPEPAFGANKRALRQHAVMAALAREELDLDALFAAGPSSELDDAEPPAYGGAPP